MRFSAAPQHKCSREAAIGPWVLHPVFLQAQLKQGTVTVLAPCTDSRLGMSLLGQGVCAPNHNLLPQTLPPLQSPALSQVMGWLCLTRQLC